MNEFTFASISTEPASVKKDSPPLKVLHVGNIANNAYNNAKIQRASGIEADVICFDYYHIMSCPEWEDSGFEGEIKDPFKPDWWSVDLKGYERPLWFAQGPVSLCRKYLIAKQKHSFLARPYWALLEFSRWILLNDNPHSSSILKSPSKILVNLLYKVRYWVAKSIWGFRNVKSILINKFSSYLKYSDSGVKKTLHKVLRATWRIYKRGYRKLRALLIAALTLIFKTTVLATLVIVSFIVKYVYKLLRAANLVSEKVNDEVLQFSAKFQQYIESFFKNRSPTVKGGNSINIPVGARKEDVEPYLADLSKWQSLYEQYDIIQAYSVDPIRPMLAGLRNYAAYEHGTIREIPFIDDSQGRLTRLCYQDAPIVFITNADNIQAARRLELDADRVVYLPHAFDERKLLSFKDKNINLAPNSADTITFFSPSRQHWKTEDPSYSKCNDRFILAFAAVCQTNKQIHAKLVEWGEDVEASKKLISDLGIKTRITWVPTMKKRQLWQEYIKSHAVVDQFLIPAIGGVTFEAMTLGRRVLTSIDIGLNTEFFGATPEVLICSKQQEIEQRIKEVVADPLDVDDLGARATKWIKQRHSSQRVVELQNEAYHKILNNVNYST